MKKNPHNDHVGDLQSPALQPHTKGLHEPGGLALRQWLALAPFVLVSMMPAHSAVESNLSAPIAEGTHLNLTLIGYNYTSRYIDGFSVNGQGGGNLYVSGPNSGGGSSVCCVSYVKGATVMQVVVRWQSGGCMYRAAEELEDGTTHLAHSFYRELKVLVNSRIPSRPAYFEVHFYPDGHVEAAISDRVSSPRLVYSKERADRSKFPKCPNEKKPS